jgi:hypothetical protein
VVSVLVMVGAIFAAVRSKRKVSRLVPRSETLQSEITLVDEKYYKDFDDDADNYTVENEDENENGYIPSEYLSSLSFNTANPLATETWQRAIETDYERRKLDERRLADPNTNAYTFQPSGT